MGWYVGEGVGSGDGCTEKGLGVSKFGNGGEESTLGDSVGCVSGRVGIPLIGLGALGAFGGFAVEGFDVRGLFSVRANVGRLLIGLGVGFLFFGLFVGSCVHP